MMRSIINFLLRLCRVINEFLVTVFESFFDVFDWMRERISILSFFVLSVLILISSFSSLKKREIIKKRACSLADTAALELETNSAEKYFYRQIERRFLSQQIVIVMLFFSAIIIAHKMFLEY